MIIILAVIFEMHNISLTDNPYPAENNFYWITKIIKFYQTFYDVSVCLSCCCTNRAKYVILMSYVIFGYFSNESKSVLRPWSNFQRKLLADRTWQRFFSYINLYQQEPDSFEPHRGSYCPTVTVESPIFSLLHWNGVL